MVAALLAPGTSVLKNVPKSATCTWCPTCCACTADVTVDGANGVVTIDATNVQLADVADVDTLSGSSRIPILFSGPLLHRLGEGCSFRRSAAATSAVVRLTSIWKPCASSARTWTRNTRTAFTSPLRTVCMARRSTCRTRPWATPSRHCSPPCSPKARPSFPAPPSNLRSWIW